MSRATFIHSLLRGAGPLNDRSPARASIASIIRKTASEHGLSASQITGRNRTARVAKARHEAVLRVHETGRYTFSQIGREFGGRDHTTMLNSIKRGRELRARHD